jgi:hypothetical protein
MATETTQPPREVWLVLRGNVAPLNEQEAREYAEQGGGIAVRYVLPATDDKLLCCSRCGKFISTAVPAGTVVRAFCECPECIEKTPPPDTQLLRRLVESVKALLYFPRLASQCPPIEVISEAQSALADAEAALSNNQNKE